MALGRLTGGGAGLRNDGFLRFRVGGRALDGELAQLVPLTRA